MFFNKTQILRFPFGVPFFDIADNQNPEFCVPVSVRGNIVLRIKNTKKVLNNYLSQTTVNSLTAFQKDVQNILTQRIKSVLFELVQTCQLSIFHIESKIDKFSELLKTNLQEKLKKEFKGALEDIHITAIEIDKTSYGYQQLLSVTQEVAKATMLAEAEAKIKTIREKQILDMQTYAKTGDFERKKSKTLSLCIIFGISTLALMGIIFYLLLF